MSLSERELVLPIVRDENACLPLAINAVARYWNVNLPMKEAARIARKYPNINGSILIEGIELAERHGLECIVMHSTLHDLKRLMEMGIPPIVIIPGVGDVIQHASVISGYDDSEGTIMHYIPEEGEGGFKVGAIPQSQFEKIWSEDGRLAVIMAPSEIMREAPAPGPDALRSCRLCFISERLNLLKETEKAVASLKEAIKLDEKNETAHSLLGSIYNEQNSDECVKHYTRSVDLNKRSFLAHRGLGNYYLKIRDLPKCENYYTRALQINPTRYGSVYKNRAIARMQQGKNAQAREDLEEYLKLVRNAPDADTISQAISELRGA